MSHGVQGDGVQAVAVFRSQIELSDGGLETGGYFFKRRLLARLLEDGFRRLARIRLEHPDHILRHADEYPLSSLLNDIEAAGIAVHILPAQFKNFRGTKAGSQGEQGHIVQLRMPLFKVVQKRPDFRDYNDFPIAGLALTFVSGSLRPEQERSLKTKLRLAGTELSRRLGAVGSLT